MSRVLVIDPYYPLPRVRELLADLDVVVEEDGARPGPATTSWRS